MRADSPYKTIHDVVKSSTAPKCGATGTSSTAYYVPKLLNEVIGTNFEVVLGYQSGQDIDLSVERGEVICRAFTVTAFHAREPFISWRKKNFVNVLVQTGKKRDARLKDTPTIYELMDKYQTSKAGRNLATLVLAAGDFGRPYVMPPNTPAEQIKTMRDAFEKTMKDKNFISAAEKRKLELDPTSGEELEKLAKEVTSQSSEVVARTKKLLAK
jgi:tripartite-type tricarboxylate transporter receptor subunit TctC